MIRYRLLILTLSLNVCVASRSLADQPASTAMTVSLPTEAREGPLSEIGSIVFALRVGYDDPHWYANIGYFCDDENKKAYPGSDETPDVGRLARLDLKTGDLAFLIDDPGGSVRDPQLSYDATRVLFSYRKSGTEAYHLYEINLDGTNLRQLTDGPHDDYEPTYLPDDSIVFVSTRCNSWVNCWMTQVGVLYRCDADGGDIRRISYNAEHDNTPWVMPDGRILYTRWEYVDRSQVEFHHLWTMNPDGSNQTVHYGNMNPGIVMIDSKPIPGTDLILANFSPGHGINDHRGIATIVSAKSGPDDLSAARALHKPPHIKDPYPIREDVVLAARGKELVLIADSDTPKTLFAWPDAGEIHEPRPVQPRPREPIIPDRADPSQATGRMILADVYHGRNQEGIKPGDIAKLLVLEILPKPVNFSGGPDLTSFLGTFTLERVLGTVPVEADGSAYFEVPAGRPVFFVALDKNDMSVKRMQSFTSVMPGEVVGCVGCHESRTETASLAGVTELQALKRDASPIDPFEGLPDVVDFPRDIQPILDSHCVSCHSHENREGQVVLSGDLGPQWSHSFFTMFARKLVADGRNGLGNHPPRTIGSAASPLLSYLGGDHHGVSVSDEEWRTVWLWIESAAPYAGSYAGLRNQEDQARSGAAFGPVMGQGGEILRRRCAECHVMGDPQSETGMPIPFSPSFQNNNRGLDRRTGIHERVILDNDPIARLNPNILVNMTRPELSPLVLAPLAREAGGYGSCGNVFASRDDPDYQKLVELIRRGKQRLDAVPRYGTPGFQPNHQYVREMKRFGILPDTFDATKETLDFFATDQAYWRSFWLEPSPTSQGSQP